MVLTEEKLNWESNEDVKLTYKCEENKIYEWLLKENNTRYSLLWKITLLIPKTTSLVTLLDLKRC